MPGTTSPNNLVYPIAGDSASPRVAVTQLADSVQQALDTIRASTDRVVNYYGLAASIGAISPAPKDGDTYQESDGAKRRFIRLDGTWRQVNAITRRSRTSALNFIPTPTTVDFATAETAPSVIDFSYSAGTFTATAPGRFRVHAQFLFPAGASAHGTSAVLYHNAARIAAGDVITSTLGGVTSHVIREVELVTGDTIRIQGAASGTVPISAASSDSFIEIVRL